MQKRVNQIKRTKPPPRRQLLIHKNKKTQKEQKFKKCKKYKNNSSAPAISTEKQNRVKQLKYKTEKYKKSKHAKMYITQKAQK